MTESDPLLSRARGSSGGDCPGGLPACRGVLVGPGERRPGEGTEPRGGGAWLSRRPAPCRRCPCGRASPDRGPSRLPEGRAPRPVDPGRGAELGRSGRESGRSESALRASPQPRVKQPAGQPALCGPREAPWADTRHLLSVARLGGSQGGRSSVSPGSNGEDSGTEWGALLPKATQPRTRRGGIRTQAGVTLALPVPSLRRLPRGWSQSAEGWDRQPPVLGSFLLPFLFTAERLLHQRRVGGWNPSLRGGCQRGWVLAEGLEGLSFILTEEETEAQSLDPSKVTAPGSGAAKAGTLWALLLGPVSLAQEGRGKLEAEVATCLPVSLGNSPSSPCRP